MITHEININQVTPWQKLPLSTGVYLFKDRNRIPIYIGKANNLKERIKQHFTDTVNPKEHSIISNSRYLAWIIVGSEFEALILEANLVYRLQPKYNAALKDDKSPLYIVITKETYPKIRLLRKNVLETVKTKFVFGPLDNNQLARNLLRQIRQIVPFCTEKQLGEKPCFYHHLGLCDPCPNVISRLSNFGDLKKKTKQYQTNIQKIIRLLKGKGRRLIFDLKKTMQTAVKKEKFEQAQLLRDQIIALEKLFQTQFINPDRIADPNYLEFLRKEENRELKTVIEKGCQIALPALSRLEGYDISNLQFADATASLVVFENGLPQKDQYRRFKIKGWRRFDPEMLLEVLGRRLKHSEWPLPDLIVIDGGTPQILKIYPQIKAQYPDLCPIIGLAKNPDRVFCSKTYRYLSLKSDSLALHYLERLRDEAHRFAKKYHQQLRSSHYPF